MSRASDPLHTPFMRQYLDLKSGYPDAILFFRMGDFYELFLDDAKTAAPLMDVALTRRQGDIPMCGVPYHSCDIYIQRLLSAGKKIAIAEQKIDPANPKLMSRRVVRVVSSGTLIEDDLLSPGKSSYLMAVAPGASRKDPLGIAIADISTGEFFALEADPPEREGDDEARANDVSSVLPGIRDLYYSCHPVEIVTTTDFASELRSRLPESAVPVVPAEGWRASPVEGRRRLEAVFGVRAKALGFADEGGAALGAVSLILHYVDQAFPEQAPRLEAPGFRESAGNHMLLEEKTIRNLNLFEPVETSLASLFACRAAAGRRRLRDILLRPLLSTEEIIRRQMAVTRLFGDAALIEDMQSALSRTFDLERVLTRMDGGRGRPGDFRAIIETVRAAIRIHSLLKQEEGFSFFRVSDEALELARHLDAHVVEEPAALPGNSPFLREGINSELDEARKARDEGARWILELEEQEKIATGIPNLKIRYNRVAGYYIEISRTQARNAPEHYERKQTLVGGERYTTPALKEIERKILSADVVIESSEQEAFDRLTRDTIACRAGIRTLMTALAHLDVLQAFAATARLGRWTAPEIVDSGEILIEESRHPVVEKFLPASLRFTPNDIRMNQTDRSFALLTGPNMAGKSTYIRQAALIQLLAQAGSFVPARKARLTPADRIFTRIGAQDDLARGESTFFVEMLETSAILRKCTERSLVIMDEVGRGTSTYDGLSIAWAVAEFLTEGDCRPRVLFATHYHELTALEERPGIFNLTMDVRESEGKVIFLHHVREGTADRSYGLHVARLAGLPRSVVDRAGELLEAFESRSLRESEALDLRGTPQLPLKTNSKTISETKTLHGDPSAPEQGKSPPVGSAGQSGRRGRQTGTDESQATLF